MSIQFKRGTTAQHAAYTGAVGELTFDTDKKVPVLHDGVTPGGWPQGAANNIAIATTGGTTTLTAAQTSGTSFEISGALTSNAIIVVPNSFPMRSFENLTTGAFTVQVKTAAGTGSIIEQGSKIIIYANGTNAESLSGLGNGQSMQNVLASRAASTTYYNTTGKPIVVYVWANNISTAGGFGLQLSVGGVTIQNIVPGASLAANNASPMITAVVPPGAAYSVNLISSTLTGAGWVELR